MGGGLPDEVDEAVTELSTIYGLQTLSSDFETPVRERVSEQISWYCESCANSCQSKSKEELPDPLLCSACLYSGLGSNMTQVSSDSSSPEYNRSDNSVIQIDAAEGIASGNQHESRIDDASAELSGSDRRSPIFDDPFLDLTEDDVEESRESSNEESTSFNHHPSESSKIDDKHDESDVDLKMTPSELFKSIIMQFER